MATDHRVQMRLLQRMHQAIVGSHHPLDAIAPGVCEALDHCSFFTSDNAGCGDHDVWRVMAGTYPHRGIGRACSHVVRIAWVLVAAGQQRPCKQTEQGVAGKTWHAGLMARHA